MLKSSFWNPNLGTHGWNQEVRREKNEGEKKAKKLGMAEAVCNAHFSRSDEPCSEERLA